MMGDQWDYLNQRKGIVVSGLPGNSSDADFSQRIWSAVLGAASRGGRCDVQFLIAALQGQPRDCLLAPIRRQELVSAMVPLLEGETETKVGCFLTAVQQYHDSGISANGGVCRLGHPHILLYVAAGVAVHYKLGNSVLISSLLKSIYACDGGLEKVLAPPLLGHRLTHVLAGWKPHDKEAEEPSTLIYWVMHATCAQLSVGRDRARIQDAPMPSLQFAPPLTVAVQTDNVRAVQNLLFCGAQPDSPSQQSPLFAILSKLSTHARSTLSARPACLCDPHTHLIDYRSCSNENLLHQVKELGCSCERSYPLEWPSASLEILQLLLSCTGGRQLPRNAEVVHPRIITDGLLGFPTLKQTCRCAIRSRLHQRWQLPQGVAALPIPSALQKYISMT